jgi:hypothetical protein
VPSQNKKILSVLENIQTGFTNIRHTIRQELKQ